MPSSFSQAPFFTFIDLFAGIGGMRLGFEAAGGLCVFTCERDRYCQQTYRANFGSDAHAISGDITELNAEDIPDHDVLLAGFPCQPFSIAGVSKKNSLGRPHGFECKTQGTLFFDVARILAARRPRMFLLENVKNLRSHDRGQTFAVIREVLRELGYTVSAKVIDSSRFVPQRRERILIAGFREDTGFDWPEAPAGNREGGPTLGSVLHPEDGSEADPDDGRYLEPDGSVNPRYLLSEKLWAYLQAYAQKHREKGNGFGCSVFGSSGVARTLSARYYKDGSEILIGRGPDRTPRRLTPRECARLMGFPDSFRIPVSDTRAYKQFGNSVVVPVIRYAASIMMSQEHEHTGKLF